MDPIISLICSTYNQPHFLTLVLDSISKQLFQNFELIIADDGSGPETRAVIKQYQRVMKDKLIHLWHKDNGWRKSEIHNAAIRKSRGKLLVFIDGDCILSSTFLKDHADIFRKERMNYVLMGRRVELGPQITKKLNLNNYQQYLLSPFSFKLMLSCISKDSRGYLRKFSLKSKVIRKIFKAGHVHDLLGANFSLPRDMMDLINGFNEDYQRGEDGDIFVRLRNSNIKIIGMKYFAVMYHQWHQRGDYQYVDNHYKELLKKTAYTWAEKGLVNSERSS